jgi:hypothetical protein
MATIGISEFTFGYAFLYEQTQRNWGNLRLAPIFPSLGQEQQQGWDAYLPVNGIDYYYQFKLSDYLSRPYATFMRDGTYNAAYYRVALHRKDSNRQHQRLRDHAQANPYTYYVAPEFNRLDDFHAAFLAGQITNNSRIIPAEDCDDILDGDQHYLTFQEGQTDWIQHSELRRHEHSFSGRELEALYRNSSPRWKRIDKLFADDLFEKTSTTLKRVLAKEERRMMTAAIPLLDFNPHQAETRDVFIRTSQILSVALGVTLMVVGTSE